MVYSLLLSRQRDPTYLVYHVHTERFHYHGYGTLLRPAVLRTCKLIYAEAVNVLYSNLFTISFHDASRPKDHPNLLFWFNQIGKRNANTIKSLRLLGDCQFLSPGSPKHEIMLALYSWTVGRAINQVLDFLKGVQVLEVTINSSYLCIYMQSPVYFLTKYPRILSILGPELWDDMEDVPFEKFIRVSDKVKELVVLPSHWRGKLDEEEKYLQQYLNDLLAAKKRSKALEEAQKSAAGDSLQHQLPKST